MKHFIWYKSVPVRCIRLPQGPNSRIKTITNSGRASQPWELTCPIARTYQLWETSCKKGNLNSDALLRDYFM
ncbi:unnamed protein product [Acanthoscelides obtectus]|uniref:Uncharacterized protein n=1 Tax=Acanthoscelides obtectus TaxID=200917 RepID=A0A9P0KA81_ACAOB|nr:unnamed protein product [Acanthoscelides obtectus]CAK1679959.1 hypothetical protein AOBTE_LOCUS32474 [Acanthoscelides obtectus]